MLGSHQSRLRFANDPPTMILVVGLQGSGKTTSTGKLARWLSRNGHSPLMVSVDVYRPAARHQLSVIARDIGLPVYEGLETEKRPSELARGARREAAQTGRDVVLVDTAGRLHIDEDLMTELQELKQQLAPTEILFVADAMTGQDAVKSAEEFHKRLGITGVILTKMDGDARGGAALSIRHVTGQPLKFVGVGEKFDALEPFHPDRAASRILGMGDVLSFIEKVGEAVDQKQAEETAAEDPGQRFHARGFPRPDAAAPQAGAARVGPVDAAGNGSAEEPEGREGGRRPDHARGGDHRLDDPQGARQPHDYQRFPPAPDRPGQRDHAFRKSTSC